jgi:hypothetical protein
MTKLISLWLLIFSLIFSRAQATSLQVGDVLLQPLKCWACTLIEEEEETIFSHIGVVLSLGPEVLVAEAFGSVRKVTLSEFNRKTEPGQRLAVLRFRNQRIADEFQKRSAQFQHLFEKDFLGAKYDHDFLWNNFDEAGQEKYYCSELVSKLFQAFLRLETPIKRMHFEKNRDQWMKYFRGNIPDQQWGNSPADFQRSDMFYILGEL